MFAYRFAATALNEALVVLFTIVSPLEVPNALLEISRRDPDASVRTLPVTPQCCFGQRRQYVVTTRSDADVVDRAVAPAHLKLKIRAVHAGRQNGRLLILDGVGVKSARGRGVRGICQQGRL